MNSENQALLRDSSTQEWADDLEEGKSNKNNSSSLEETSQFSVTNSDDDSFDVDSNNQEEERNHGNPNTSGSQSSRNHEDFEINDDDLGLYMDSPHHQSTSFDSPGLRSPASYQTRKSHPNIFLEIFYRLSDFFDGPKKPRDPFVTPIFKTLQHFPIEISRRWPNFICRSILWTFLILWTLLFYIISKNSILAIPKVNDKPVDILTCGTTLSVWLGKNEKCGINGTQCGAMEPDVKELIFKCPAGCSDDSHTWSYTPVGDYESIYRPYVIGGGNSSDVSTMNNYRADSYICASAIHHGYMSNKVGRCGRILFNGPQEKFLGSKGHSDIESLTFDSWFPQSYSIDDEFMSNFEVSGCHDLRITVIWLNISLSVIFSYFMTNGLIFYWVMMILGFWTVALGSNPPWTNSNFSSEEAIAELVSASFRRFLPYMLGAYVVWRASGRGLLLDLDAHFSKTVLWLGGFWVALMENYTFSKLPINRLIISDIKQQKGGFLALIIIVGVILSAAVGQAYIIWRMGKFKKYITIYISMILGLVVLGNFPNQTLRIHHYILGLLLLPGVGFKTTMGLLYQGLLAGLYVSGVARWDFDSIVQTAIQLNRGDALNFGGLPELLEPIFDTVNGTDVTLQWNGIGQTAAAQGAYLNSLWNGFSLIVNDIELYRGNDTSYSLGPWISSAASSIGKDILEKVYIRLAFANNLPSIGKTGDYTKAGVINLVTGEWTSPLPGPS